MCLAIPGQILSVTGENPLLRTGRVRFGGIIKDVNLAYVPEATIGDYVVVHVGFAISTIAPEEAERVFTYLQQLADPDEDESL